MKQAGLPGECEGETMDRNEDFGMALAEDPPGIVIHGTFGPQPRPAISAFVWGNKVSPAPELPYGRRPAA